MHSDFEILIDDEKYLMMRIEVFPTKISYKDDYQQMINDISEMVCEAAIDFMTKTYEQRIGLLLLTLVEFHFCPVSFLCCTHNSMVENEIHHTASIKILYR